VKLSELPEWEKKSWIALLLLAAALHLYKLGERPLHHDESIHAMASLHLAHEGLYKYDPVYHGPVQYFAVATTFRLLGDSDTTARMPAALGGVLLAALALLLRPRFGPAVALVSGALLAFSPSLLYYTRFCREDAWSLLGTAGTFLFLDAFWRERKLSDLCLAALAAAIAFAAKENFYVLLALMPPSILAAWLEPGRGLDLWNRLRRIIDFLEKHFIALAGALLLFFIVSELLYTVFLNHPESGNPAFDAISYWWAQHKVERVGGPKTFHLPRLLLYEFLVIVPGLVWPLLRWKTLSAGERFLAGWGVSSVAMYAYLGEKTPWLMVHQVLPFVPLAARAWVEAWERSRLSRAVCAVAASVSLVFAISLSFWLPAITPASRRAEAVIYVQTCPELVSLADEILAHAKVGDVPAGIVAGDAGWPMTWYVRRAPVNWEMPTPERKAAIVITDVSQAEEAARILGPDYRRSDVPFRAWWLPETSWKPLRPSFSDLVRYVFTREVWNTARQGENPIGAVLVAVFRRTTPAAPPPAPPAPPAPSPAGASPLPQ
jgi:uncharacterized protein (TIGR03663 family)